MIAKRIYYTGKEIYNRDKQGRFSSFSNKLGKITKRAVVISGIVSVLGWYGYGAYISGYAKEPITIVKEVQADNGLAPVLKRIMQCESGGMHKKDGQVIVNTRNSDKSYDIGIFQINSIHNKEATKMGYDLSIEADNIAYAMHLYSTSGTEAWYSSKTCWNK
jgi:hypothetical protein